MRGKLTPERVAAIGVAVAALLYFVRIDEPPGRLRSDGGRPMYIYDECYQAFTAHRYVLGDANAWNPRATKADQEALTREDVTPETAYEWTHPPASKLLIATSIRLFGFSPAGYRIGSVLAALATLGLTWLIGVRLGSWGPDAGRGGRRPCKWGPDAGRGGRRPCKWGPDEGRGGRRPSKWLAALAVWLLAFDCMLFGLARLAMSDMYLTCALTLAWYAYLRAWTVSDEKRARAWLLAGGAFGLALTVKWSALAPFAGAFVLSLGRLVTDAARGKLRGAPTKVGGAEGPVSRRALAVESAGWLGGFVIAPPILYLLSYTPYLLHHSFAQLVDLQRQMWWFHHHLQATHSQASRWWTWPLLLRPVWLWVHRFPGELVGNSYLIGNPISWWLFVPAFLYLAVRFLRKREPGDALLLCGFGSAWLPWAFVSRVAFVQYLLPGVPFGVLAIARALDDLRALKPRLGRGVAIGYVLACALAFANLYPLTSGLPVPSSWLKGHALFWFDDWRGERAVLAAQQQQRR